METSAKKKKIPPLEEQTNWLDQEWGGSNWLPDVVRVRHENPPTKNALSITAVTCLVRMTQIAQREGIPLSCLWSADSPYNFLWARVKNTPSLRLTVGIAMSAYADLKCLVYGDVSKKGPAVDVQGSGSNGDAGIFIKDSDIEEDGPDPESESSGDEDIQPFVAGGPTSAISETNVIHVKESPRTPSRMSITNKDHRAFTHGPFLQSPSPQDSPRTSDASPTSPVLGSWNHFHTSPTTHASKRKREGDSIAEGQPRKKRSESAKRSSAAVAEEAASIYQQLTNNVKLTDTTLDFLANLIATCYTPDDGNLRVAHPLWLKLDSNGPRTAPLKKKLENCTKFCLVIHHNHPKHWTLAIVDISPNRMVFNYHDSMADNDRFSIVCSRFREWKEQQGLAHELEFRCVAPCTVQQDNINCGIHVLSCLRHELTGNSCPLYLDQNEERGFLVRLLKMAKEEDYSGYHKHLLQEVKKVIDSRDKKELWKAIEHATSESLEAEGRCAELARNDTRNDLKAAEAVMGELQVKKAMLIEARDRVNQAFDAENASPPANILDLRIRDLGPREAISQQKVITARAEAVECILKMSHCDASDIAKKVFQQLIRDIGEKVKRAEVDIEQKKLELQKAERLVNRLNHMRNANEALTNMPS